MGPGWLMIGMRCSLCNLLIDFSCALFDEWRVDLTHAYDLVCLVLDFK